MRSPASRTRSSSATRASTDLVLIGIRSRGVDIAERLAAKVAAIEGVEVPTRHHRHHPLPRRPQPRAAQQPAGEGNRHPLPDRRSPGRAGRRRALHRPHRPRRARRADGLRPAAQRPTGRADRPRASRAADPRRLRGQEPAHGGRTNRSRYGSRSATGATRSCSSPQRRAEMAFTHRHLLGLEGTVARGAPLPDRHRGLVQGDLRARHQEGADPARQDRGRASSTRPAPARAPRSRSPPSA